LPKRKRNPGGRHPSLTPQQIENGINILRNQPRMAVEAAYVTLRDAGITRLLPGAKFDRFRLTPRIVQAAENCKVGRDLS
jgi:hypothetical protein